MSDRKDKKRKYNISIYDRITPKLDHKLNK